nr:tRNA 5-methoxyuridine(34)/uridine 5-oxyacetic acid(34) synthase CmoB [Alkalimarinus sediminis]
MVTVDFFKIYQDLFQYMKQGPLNRWLDNLIPQLEQRLLENPHGDLGRWQAALNRLPDIQADNITLTTSAITANKAEALSEAELVQLTSGLMALSPWRKGPFQLFDTYINTEWHSDWKWDRVVPHISSLKNRVVLDVGCGSGYHCWRMLGEGADRVIGIDPNYLFLTQFEAIKKYCGPKSPIHLLPVKMEEVPSNLEAFDTTFSMGVLYHRRSPIDHLLELKSTLRKGGELVLETLVIEGDNEQCLMPEDRYAMMRNVWFIPSCDTLALWLKRAGFKDIKLVDLNRTTTEEQRATEWMTYQSLNSFLDPEDPAKTIEGYPAPLRATFVATK